MLEIFVPPNELFDPVQNKFINIAGATLILEHSLISIAKWEARWHIPYLDQKPRSQEQELDYIRCMAVGPIKDNWIFANLTAENIKTIREYMQNPMTATTFPKKPHSPSREVVTAETLYCRMFANNIPLECHKWHLNRLLTLIKACEVKNGGKNSKMSKRQSAAYYAEQNALRRAKFKSKG